LHTHFCFYNNLIQKKNKIYENTPQILAKKDKTQHKNSANKTVIE